MPQTRTYNMGPPSVNRQPTTKSRWPWAFDACILEIEYLYRVRIAIAVLCFQAIESNFDFKSQKEKHPKDIPRSFRPFFLGK